MKTRYIKVTKMSYFRNRFFFEVSECPVEDITQSQRIGISQGTMSGYPDEVSKQLTAQYGPDISWE